MTARRRAHLLTFCAVGWALFAGVAMSAPPSLYARAATVVLASLCALFGGMALEARTYPDALRKEPR